MPGKSTPAMGARFKHTVAAGSVTAAVAAAALSVGAPTAAAGPHALSGGAEPSLVQSVFDSGSGPAAPVVSSPDGWGGVETPATGTQNSQTTSAAAEGPIVPRALGGLALFAAAAGSLFLAIRRSRGGGGESEIRPHSDIGG